MLISIKNVIFQGGGGSGPPIPPSGSAYGKAQCHANWYFKLDARIQKVLSDGSNSENVCCFLFLVDEVREDPTTTKSGPSSARQQNTIEMAFLWRADNSPILNAGLVAL